MASASALKVFSMRGAVFRVLSYAFPVRSDTAVAGSKLSGEERMSGQAAGFRWTGEMRRGSSVGAGMRDSVFFPCCEVAPGSTGRCKSSVYDLTFAGNTHGYGAVCSLAGGEQKCGERRCPRWNIVPENRWRIWGFHRSCAESQIFLSLFQIPTEYQLSARKRELCLCCLCIFSP